jgi:hypothetical protein
MAKIGETRNLPDKLIDTWTYKVKDVELDALERVPQEGEDPEHPYFTADKRSFDERNKLAKKKVTNKHVTVNVYMVKRTEQSEEPPHPLNSARLLIRCNELNIKIEGTDIVAMKDAMWSMLDKKYEIKWERYYQVQVLKSRVYGGDGTGLEIVYDDVYKGTTWDGKHLLKRWRGHEFRIDVWPGAFKDESGKVMACIPATEENLEALKEFCRRVDILRGKLADFLKPEVIQQNLVQLAGCRLLPEVAPDPDEHNEDR